MQFVYNHIEKVSVVLDALINNMLTAWVFVFENYTRQKHPIFSCVKNSTIDRQVGTT